MFEPDPQCFPHSMTTARHGQTGNGARRPDWWIYSCFIVGIVCLLQLPVVVDGAFTCPTNCTCDTYKVSGVKYQNVSCIGAGLTQVPSDGKEGADVVKLILSNNQIGPSINRSMFQYFTNLEELDLSYNQISSIDDDTFDDLTNLLILNLGANIDITTLPSRLFEDQTSLVTLNLTRNTNFELKSLKDFDGDISALDISHLSLTDFPKSAIKELDSLTALYVNNNNITSIAKNDIQKVSLEILDLSYNSITSFDKKALDDQNNLTFLNLSHNYLEIIDSETFEETVALEVLDLSFNLLTTLDSETFDDTPDITTLNLENNHLTSLPNDVFSGLTAMTTLDLENNNLTSLDASIFGGLSAMNSIDLSGNLFTFLSKDTFSVFSSYSLDISSNPFTCDCAFRNFLHGVTFNTANNLVNQDDTRCTDSGTEYAYLDWDDSSCDGNLGSTCATTEDCMAQNAQCNGTTLICVCRSFYYDNNGVGTAAGLCKPQVSLDYPCDISDACETSNSECSGTGTKRCLCVSGHYDDSPNYLGGNCHPKLNLGGSCTFDDMCNTSNAYCGPTQKCVCLSTHYDNNTAAVDSGECILKFTLHTACDTNDQCGPANSECSSNTCECSTGFYEIDNSGLCQGPNSFYSCYKDRTSSVHINFEFAATKASTDLCEQFCFTSNARYYLLISNVCVCGNIDVNGTCCPWATDTCNLREYIGPTVNYVTSGMVVSFIPELYVGMSHTFEVSTTLSNIDQIKWLFGASQTEVVVSGSSSSQSYTYTYSGKYDMTIKACEQSSSVCDIATLPVRVQVPRENLTTYITGRGISSLWECISDFNATFKHGFDFEYFWAMEDSSSVQTLRKGCAPAWTGHRNKCLKHITTPATFSAAKTACTGLSATLLKLNHVDEVPKIISALGGTASSAELFTDATRTGGVWEWTSDNTKTFLTNDTLTSSTAGDCVIIDGPTETLTTVNCLTSKQYICMKDPVDCPHGGQLLDNKHCVVLGSSLSSSNLARSNAKAFCESNVGGWLANITSAQRHTSISTLLNDSSVGEALFGLSDQYLEGAYFWDDDSMHNGSEYQPTLESGTGNCYVTKPGNIWAKVECGVPKDFVCEYSQNTERLTISSYMLGVPDVRASGTNLQRVVPFDIFTSTTINTKVMLFPGLVFSKAGNIRYWIVHTKHVSSGESFNIAFFIVRPTCTPDYLVQPGCIGTKFATCSTSNPSCTPNTCSTSQHFCYLSNLCKSFNESCTCNSETGLTTACSSSGTPPQYTVHAQTHVTVRTTGENTIIIPAADLPVNDLDVVALQFPSGQNVINCENLPSDNDQQSVYTADQTGWLSKGDVFPTSVKSDEDMTCYFQSIYTETQMKTLAPNLGCPSDVGAYDLSVNIIDTDVRELDVTLEEPVDFIDIIYPTVTESSTGHDCLGNIATELGASYDVTVRVGFGNNKMFSFDSSTPVTFQSTCTSNVLNAISSPDLCNSSLVWSVKPFASVSFTPLVTGTSNKTITVTNTLGTTTKYVTVQTERRISGMTFALQTSARISNNVALNRISSFQTDYTTGTAVSYSYMINGVSVSATSSTLNHTFTSIGTYTVSAFLTNILGAESVNLTMYAKQPAEASSCRFPGSQHVAVINVPIDIVVQCTVNSNAEISADFYFEDDASTQTLGTTTTTGTTESWTYTKTFTSTALGVQVNATLNDPFESVTAVTSVDVYNSIPSVNLVVTNSDILDGNSASLAATVPSTPGSYGTVEYTVNFGDLVIDQGTSGTFTHTYGSPGSYTVNITASNGPSSVFTAQTINVYSEVRGLNVVYNGPNKKGDVTTLTASNTDGNLVSFTFYSSEFNISQSSASFGHVFTTAGVHQVDITCSNALSSQARSLTVYVLEATEILVENLQVNGLSISGCLESVTNNLFSVSVIHYATASLTYLWDFDDGTIETALTSKSHIYSDGGNFTLNVTVTYSTESASQSISAVICIQDRIEGASIGVGNQVGLPSTKTLDLAVTVTVTKGTSITYVWTSNTTIVGTSTGSTVNLRITSVGWYQISVAMANSINSATLVKLVQVIEEISNVTINCPTCTDDSGSLYTVTGSSSSYNVQTTTGTSLSYLWAFGDGLVDRGSSVTHTYPSIGSYTLTVSVFNDVHMINQTVTVYAESSLTSVTVAPYGLNWKNNLVSPMTKDGDINTTAQLSASPQPTGMPLTYVWEFDTGLTPVTTTSHIANYTFTKTGRKSCTVTAVNQLGNVTSSTLIFFILEPITNMTVKEGTNNLATSTTHLIAQNHVYNISITSDQFIADTVEYTIIIRHASTKTLIGSGQTSSIQVNFTRTGEHILITSVQNSLNKATNTEEVKQYTIEAIEPVTGPYINVDNGVSGNITSGLSIQLNGGSSVGKYLTFYWTYASAPTGQSLSSTDQNITLTPSVVGSYVVRLTISNPVSSNLNVEYSINVQQAVTGVAIAVTPDAVKVGSTVVFQATVTTGTDLSYNWMAVGDVNPLNADTQSFTITFGLQAYYNITLVVSNYASSGTDVKRIFSLNELSSVNIQVSSGASYNSNINKYVVITGTDVDFSSDITIVQFVEFGWQIDSTSSGTNNDFTNTFNTVGTYLIQLSATNKISSVSNQVTILVQDPISNFMVTGCNSTYLLNTDISLTSTISAGTDISVEWKGDSTITGSVATVSYGTEGEHSLNVTASNYVSSKTVSCIITTQGTISNLVITVSTYKFVRHAVTFSITGDFLTSASFTWTFSHGITTTTTTSSLDQIFSLNGDYNVTVNVSNEVSWSTVSVSFTVEDLKCALPNLRIDGSSERTAPRGFSIELVVTVSTSGCTDYASVNRWIVYEASSCSATLSTVYILPTTITTNTPILQFPAASLPYNQYCVVFENSYRDTPVIKWAYFNLTIVKSPLLAFIYGGDARVSSAGTTLTLNGNNSQDPDNSTGVVIQFSWSCSQTMGTAAAIKVCSDIAAKTSSWFSLTALTLTTGDVYEVTLTVSASGRENGITRQKITIADRSAPVVGIECISCVANNNYNTNPSKKTCFQGTCTSGCTTSSTYAWTITDQGTNTQITIAASQTTTGTDSINLCLNAGTLSHNTSYNFKLEASTGSQVGFAEQSLGAATPPDSGTCDLSSTGNKIVPLTTTVTVTCQNYTDQDAMSGLYYYIGASHGNDEYIVYFGSQSVVEFYLSPWPGTNYADVTITVYVVNDHGINVTALTENVKFTAPTLLLSQTDNVNYIIDQIIGTMPTIANQNNPNLLVRYITAVLLFLNDQSENGVNTTAVRMAIRDLMASSLDGIPYTTVFDVRQIASAVEYLSNYTEEISKSTLILVESSISSLATVLDSKVQKGHDQNFFNTDSLLESIANMHSSLQSITSTTSDAATKTKFGSFNDYELDISSSSSTKTYSTEAAMLADLTKKSVNHRIKLTAVVLQTLVPDEQKIEKTLTDGSTLIAQHVSVENIGNRNSQDGVTIIIPSDILDYSTYNQDSVFQISVINSINPFTYGYDTVLAVNTKTVQTGFLDLTGGDIAISSLPPSKEVILYMFAEGVPTYSIPTTGLLDASGYSPRSGVTNSSCTDLTAGNTRYMTVPQSTDTTAGVHVQILPEFSSSQATGYLIATLYKDAKAYTSNDAILSVRPLNVTYNIYSNTLADHTTYTFFIPVSERGTNAFKVSLLTNLNVHVCVSVYYAKCSYFNTNSDTWSSDGCTPMKESIPTVAKCSCNHMTSYGSGLLLSPDQIDFTDLSDLDIVNNPVAIITCSVILGLYIILVILSRRMDKLDMKHISSIPLCGKDGSFKYEVMVFTGRQLGAGTSAHVGIQLLGSYWKTAQKHIYKEGAFQRNCCDTFIVAHDVNLGEVAKIRIWHDNSGTSPSWYLDRVVVKDLQTDQQYYFYSQSWLTLETTNGSIQKNISAAGAQDRNRFGHKFNMALFNSLADKHLWLSLLNRPAQSRFTRVQRATCCVTLLFTFICVNAMWYGLLKKDNQDLGWESFNWEEIILAIVTNVMVLPINLGLIFLFKKSRSKANLFEIVQKPQTAQSIEIENDCENSRGGSFESRNTTDFPFDLDRESTIDSVPAYSRALHRSKNVSRRQRENSDENLDRVKRGNIAFTNSSGSPHWDEPSSSKWPDNVDYNDGLDSRPSTSSTAPPPHKKSLGNKAAADLGAYKKRKTVGKAESDELLAELDKMEKDLTEAESRPVRSASSRHSESSSRSRKLTMSELEGLEDILNSDDETSFDNKPAKRFVSRSKAGSRFNPRADPRINGNGHHLTSRGSAISSMTNGEPEASGSGVTAGLRPLYYSELTMESRDIQHVPIHKEKCLLPPWCIYIAYVLCFLLCTLSVIIVILYCFKFGADEALKWVLACLLSLVLSFLVVEPLKALMIALYMVAMFKDVEKTDEDDCIEINPSIDMSHENIQEQIFQPISGFALVKAKEEGRKIRRMKTMIRQFFAYMFYLWTIMVVVYVHFHHNSYLFTKYVETSFVNATTTNYVSYNNISTIDEFWDWTENVFADSLHLQDSHTDEEHGFPLGAARMRLIRSLSEKCLASTAASSLGTSVLTDRICYGDGGFDEDTGFYGERWNESSYNKSWKYVWADKLGGSDKLGFVATYSGGGFLQTLGTSYAETLTIIQDLKDKAWIDLQTRAVIFEFSYYSPGSDMTAVTSMLVEFPLTGGVITSYDILSQKLLWFQKNRVDPLMVMECILLLVVIYSCVHIVQQVREKRVAYFKEFWHWYEMLTTLATVVSIGMYMGCVIEATNTFNHFLDDQSGFTNFERVAHVHVGMRYLYAWLLFLLMYKVVKQLRFIKFFYVFGETLSSASGHIAGAFLIYIILLLTYAQLGYLMYGRNVPGFESVGHAVSTLIVIIRGTFDFWPLLSHHPVFSHFYVVSYYAFAYGLLMALVIAILQSCYKISQSKIFYKDNLDMKDYEMIDFMMKRFKLWAGFKKPKPAFRRVHFPDLPQIPSRASTAHSNRSVESTDSTFEPESYEPYVTRMAGRLGPTWQLFLRRFDQLEILDQEEQRLVMKTEALMKDLNLRCRINEFERQGKEILSSQNPSKPPLRDSKQRQSQILANHDNQGRKAPSTVTGASSRTAGTPPSKELDKPVMGKRPLSDQGARPEQMATRRASAPEKSKIQKFLRTVKPSRPAWSKEEG